MNKPAPIVLLKIGGTVAVRADRIRALFSELRGFAGRCVVVHGGGKAVTDLSRRLGIEPTFIDGVRITTPADMELVDMVLAGRVNTELVRRARTLGIAAVGLTGADGALLTGRLMPPPPEAPPTRTATPVAADPTLLEEMLKAGYLPIVASVAVGTDGEAVNINADDAAHALAEALGSRNAVTLCYLSDIPGVLDADGRRIERLTPEDVERLIADGVARDGMAAKLRSCVKAVRTGVSRVVIGEFVKAGDVDSLVTGDGGTSLVIGDDR